jgi:very-short-patch-repair endonuclease
MTIGIISMLGSDQSRLIDQQIRRYYAPGDPHLDALKGGGGMTRRLCGEPPNFQGDERGVIILSVVDSGQLGGPLNKLATGTFQSRYNVAASRAQDQLWVVHSLDPARDLQPDDLRRRLIEHAIDPKRLLDVAMEAAARAESPFEREVIEILTGKGFSVRPQFAAGAYRIDMVVVDGNKRVAVECDGERAHPPEKLREDVQRQAILERRGWHFARIRGSAFYRDRASALVPLFQRLEELGIRPTLGPGQPKADADSGSELVKEVIRQAEQLEEEWASRDAAEAAMVQAALPEPTRRRSGYWKHPN